MSFVSLPANRRQQLIAQATESSAGTLADLRFLLSQVADESLRAEIGATINQLVATLVAATQK